jgi:hypothetical protein
MNRQARIAGSSVWFDYGNVGLIEAAKIHAEQYDFKTPPIPDRLKKVEVRDADEPDAIYVCNMRRVTTYVCENPRGDSDK